MRFNKIYIIYLIFIFGLVRLHQTAAQNILNRDVLGNGSEILTDSTYSINGTLGQPIIGVVQNSKHINRVGFFYQPFDILATNINQFITNIPIKFALKQNYPNPFNPSTKIKYDLPKSSKVKIEVFNLIGQKIKTLLNKHTPAGSHEVEFNGTDISSGVYFYKIETEKFIDTKKMVLLR
ncbi:T9SS type A sorting domain-containing protein [Calditrichota bacterium]